MKVRAPNEVKYNKKFEILKNSLNSLKLILNPNLNEQKKNFLNSIIDMITSQIKLYINLLVTNQEKETYNILNINNQNLSKKISSLYENFFKSLNKNTEIKNTNVTLYNNKNKRLKFKNNNNNNELYNNDNNNINNNYLKDIELMEEPKPLIYSSLNLDSINNNMNINFNKKEINENNDDIEMRDQIKVKKRSHNKSLNNKNNINNKNVAKRELKNNDINDYLKTNSCINLKNDSNFSSLKDDNININNENNIDIDNKKEEEWKYYENELKQNNKNIKELLTPINETNLNLEKIKKNSYKKIKINISKEIINKIKSDLEDDDINYIKTDINNINDINNKNSINEYLIPCNNPNGEQLFLIKTLNILINKSQKDTLENYIKNNSHKNLNEIFNSPNLKQVINYKDNHNKKSLIKKKINLHKNIKNEQNSKMNLSNEVRLMSHSLEEIKELGGCIPSSIKKCDQKIKYREKIINNKTNMFPRKNKLKTKNNKVINSFFNTTTNFRKMCLNPQN